MKWNLSSTHFKNTVMYIHGFLKQSSQWNVSETGKYLGIEEHLQKTTNTVLVDVEHSDYSLPITTICEDIYKEILQSHSLVKVIIVAHSYGAFYAIRLAEMFPSIIKSLILLDPVVKDENYRKYLLDQDDDMSKGKLAIYHDLPTGDKLHPRIIIKICLPVTDSVLTKLDYFHPMTNKNIMSEIVVIPEVDHMIHYHQPQKIIFYIKQHCKL